MSRGSALSYRWKLIAITKMHQWSCAPEVRLPFREKPKTGDAPVRASAARAVTVSEYSGEFFSRDLLTLRPDPRPSFRRDGA